MEEGRRNLLLRCSVKEGPPDLPPSLVIKQASREDYRPDDPDCWAARGLFRDWSGLEFLSGCGAAPGFYGGDRDLGFVIMEDLGDTEDLARVLCCGSAARATPSLIGLADALGRMHAATVGHAHRYAAIRHALGPGDRDTSSDDARQVRAAREGLMPICAALGVPLGAGFQADAEIVAAAMEDPGPFLAYTTGDPCLDNALLSADGHVRLHDFEFGGFRHALRDGVYGRMRFPSCWCVRDLPALVVAQMDEAYRRALAVGCPAARDEGTYRRAVAEACGFWLLTNLHGMLERALQFDGVWGVATLRQRIVKRLDAFVGAADEAGHLGDLRDVAARLYEALSQRWGNTLPLYDGFGREHDQDPGAVTALLSAIEADDIHSADNLLRAEPTLAQAMDRSLTPVLCRAAEQGRTALVRLLLQRGAEAETSSPFGRTALGMACANGHADVVEVLLDSGADANRRDLSGNLPIYHAGRGGHTAVVELLRHRGAQVDVAAAVYLRDLTKIATALAVDPDAVRLRWDNGNTPLHLAASQAGGAEFVRCLLNHGADVTARDAGGATPLHRAAEAGAAESAQLLLVGGADPEAMDHRGRTALALAEARGHTECARILGRRTG